MKLIAEPMPGVALIQTQTFGDSRGSFTETFNRAKMAGLGIDYEFVQDNESVSANVGTIRGIHLQLAPHAQGKLMRVLRGSVLDVAIDLRPDSTTFVEHCTVTLTSGDGRVFWIPPGFGHAFCTLEPNTVVVYKVTSLYAPESDRSVRWNDARLAIEWPVSDADAVLSDKDATAPLLADIESDL